LIGNAALEVLAYDWFDSWIARGFMPVASF